MTSKYEKEPLLQIEVIVDCPYYPLFHIFRHYYVVNTYQIQYLKACHT